MSIAEAEAAVASAIRAHELATDPAIRLHDLMSEVGELAKAFVESTGYGAKSFDRTAEWDEELGDALFALLALADATGTPVEPALAHALAKIEDRMARTGSASSSGDRQPASG
ncbi:MAG TPA: MazG nucleotide pyrophosphohydrolase domain-containing protein [Candidatus Limnocylindrales bacterium]|jgi:NTP pyrophosphatase (non-canonical NTP hydrolase)